MKVLQTFLHSFCLFHLPRANGSGVGLVVYIAYTYGKYILSFIRSKLIFRVAVPFLHSHQECEKTHFFKVPCRHSVIQGFKNSGHCGILRAILRCGFNLPMQTFNIIGLSPFSPSLRDVYCLSWEAYCSVMLMVVWMRCSS